MAVQIHTLGRFSIELDGTPQPERSGQPIRSALLLVLALDRDVTRDGTTAMLWPESDEERARQALRQTLYLLRRELGDDWLEATPDALRARTTLTADAHELVEAAAGDEHERVLKLYRGRFLPAVHLADSQPFQLWCDQWAGRLERLHRHARRAVIDRRVAAGDLAGALATAREWLELDPLEDEAQHRVVELLARLGRGDEALREYEAFESLLAGEGLRPLEDTRALAEEIRSAGRGLPPLAEPVEPAEKRGGAGSAPVAGRRGAWSRWRVLALLGVLAVTAAVVLALAEDPGGGASMEPERIMVLPLANETGDSVVDEVGLLAADWLIHAVGRIPGLQAVPLVDAQRMLKAGVSPEDAAAYRRAGTLVSGRYFRAGTDSLELHVQIADVDGGELWHALHPVRVARASPEHGLTELRDRVAGSLAVRFTPSSALPDPSTLDPPSYPAFTALMDATPYIIRSDWAGALPHVQRAVELDSTFYRARLALVTAYLSTRRPAVADSLLRELEAYRDRFSPYERVLFRGLRAEIDGDHDQKMAGVREAARIDPGGTVHYISAAIALEAGRPREAIELYSTLDPDCPWAPEWTGPWSSWTAALHLLGRHERELEEARRARALHPDRFSALYLELRALVGLGRVGAVEQRLREAGALQPEPGWNEGLLLRRVAMELRSHGQPDAASELLERSLDWYESRPDEEKATRGHQEGRLMALMAAGRLSGAARVLGELRAEDPDRPTLLALEGVLAARNGDAARADSIGRRLEQLRGPYQYGGVDYWRGVIAAWSGEAERALAFLRSAFEDGRARGIALHADLHLEPLWHLPAFQTAVGERR